MSQHPSPFSLLAECYVQATDVSEYDLQTDEKQTAVNKERNEGNGIPEKPDCYKMDAKLNPDAVESIGEE